MAASCCVNDRHRVFLLRQWVRALCVASIFSALVGHHHAGVSATRNYLVSKDKFNQNLMVAVSGIGGSVRVWANNRGLIGLIPVVATVEYTICCHHVKEIKAVKCSIFVNTFLWVFYSFAIMDFFHRSSRRYCAIIDAVSLARLRAGRRSRRRKSRGGNCGRLYNHNEMELCSC